MNALASFEIPALFIVVPLLLAVILYDLRFMRIPNKLVVLFAVVALVMAPFQIGVEEILWRFGIAGIVFLGGLIFYARGMMGAGDVKLLAVLMLLIPVEGLSAFTMLLSLSMLLGVAVLMSARRFVQDEDTRWRGLQKHSRFPLGVSIGTAGLAFFIVGPEVVRGLI